MPESGERPDPSRPRVLVTGFSAFPGVTDNPTEWLVGALRVEKIPTDAEIFLDVLPVDYRVLPDRLESIGDEIKPDIAVHFGVSTAASGFVLERRALNWTSREKADAAGYVPPNPLIHAGRGPLDTTLPLAAIHARLVALDLPVSFSDSAGDYLCNFLFYLACSPDFPAYAPKMAGFIHVPILAQETGEGGLSKGDLLAGALAIIQTCHEVWRQS